jgi:glycosyltransferase involved in cell wall biosynthesis
MALGCPPVAARSGAVTDVIRDGLDGLLVDPEGEPLSQALDRMLSDTELRRSLAGHARARAEEFSAGRMALKLVTVYEQVMGS